MGTIDTISTFTYDDFVSSLAPYEYAYQFIDDEFSLKRELEKISKQAQNVKYRNFMSTFNAYVKQVRRQTNMVYNNSLTCFECQPLELSCGQWTADESGISIYENQGERFACTHPILPILRLVNIDTGVEKLQLAYRKGKQWRFVIADKKTLASANSVLELANVGVAVNSENAKYLVRYLHDIENMNYLVIPEKNSVSRMGWIEGQGFSPYVDELVFDGDANFKHFFESVQTHGDEQIWLEIARNVRTGDIASRILLAASLSSALVKPLGGLSFFTHIWGGTEVGKTVGLMLAASVWANPELGRFIHTFNSTAVGREKSAAFVNSLPLILDELQIVADKKTFDKDIMMLAEGAGKTRGTKSGGIDKTPTWSNCIITSGEMPITNTASGGGAVNRIIEIECQNKLFADPRYIATTIKQNYGFAGKRFVTRLQEAGAIERAQALFKEFYGELCTSNTTEKQASSAALILTADALATEWIYQDGQALKAADIAAHLHTRESVSVNERAYEFLCEYVATNKNKFCGYSDVQDVWGDVKENMAFIIRSAFNKICTDNGFNPRAFLSWARASGKIEVNGKGFTISKRINGVSTHCVWLRFPPETPTNYDILDDL